jgi:hypothetical protein
LASCSANVNDFRAAKILARHTLLNQRFAYVAVSRGRFDAQVYTNDRGHGSHLAPYEILVPLGAGGMRTGVTIAFMATRASVRSMVVENLTLTAFAICAEISAHLAFPHTDKVGSIRAQPMRHVALNLFRYGRTEFCERT